MKTIKSAGTSELVIKQYSPYIRRNQKFLKMFRYLLMTGLIVICVSSLAQNQQPISIIPQPVSVKEGSGNFKINSGTRIELFSSSLQDLGKYLSDELSPATGFS